MNPDQRSEEHTSELQSRENLVCRLLLEKKKKERRPVGEMLLPASRVRGTPGHPPPRPLRIPPPPCPNRLHQFLSSPRLCFFFLMIRRTPRSPPFPYPPPFP